MKKKLKSLIGPILILLLILVGVLIIVLYKDEEETEEAVQVHAYEGGTEELVLENDKLKLVMDPTTTQFALEVKDTGKIWYSNPDGAAEDTKALKIEKEKLQSTMLLTYSTINGVDTLLNNYSYSIQNGIYEIEQGADYIKVLYSIGDVEKEYVVPPVLTLDDMDKWKAEMDSNGGVFISEYYKKYDINNLGKKDNKEELLQNYPILENEVVYILRSSVKENVRRKMEKLFEEAGYTYEDYLKDKELDLSTKVSEKPVFNVNVIYRLDGDDMVVEVPMEEIEYKENYPLLYLSILPYFGAGGLEDEGYMLVPEGGGAIINFNNGKVAQSSYYSNVYGWDMALSRKAVVHETRSYYGVFGVSNPDNSFICILEDGAPYASIQADVAGRNHNFNFVNSVHNITHREQYDVADKYNGEMYVYEPSLPNEKLVNRYCFINSDDYVDMANTYHDYLADKYGTYFEKKDDTSTPVTVELVGAIDKVKQVCGIPMSRPLKLTSYKESEAIVKELHDEGMTNMSVRITGWMNGGINQRMLSKVRYVSDLGSKKDLQKLAETVQSYGDDIYLHGTTDYASDTSDVFDGFVPAFHAARKVSKEKASIMYYSSVTYGELEGGIPYYLLKGDVRAEMVANLQKEAAKYNAGVSFENVGWELSSDFNRKAYQTRQATLNRQVEMLKAMNDSGQKVMLYLGNDYAMPYADMVLNMYFEGNPYSILDRTVPFYQMAVHGYVNYAGEPLNLTADFEDELLKSAEYGAGLQFCLMRETAFILQKTWYTNYFGADYAAWHDRMMEIYTRYNSELGHVFNQRMIDHKWVTNEMSCTVYEDGTKVYVNYSYVDAVADDGTTVPARDYKTVMP